jgi:hypothetical protein
VIGVRIHALLAAEAKANPVAVGGGIAGRRNGARAQPQEGAGQQIDDLLVRVPRSRSGRRLGDEFEFVHGKRSNGQRSSC